MLKPKSNVCTWFLLVDIQLVYLHIFHEFFYLFQFDFVPAALLQLLNHLFSKQLLVVPLRLDPIRYHYQCPISDAVFMERISIISYI